MVTTQNTPMPRWVWRQPWPSIRNCTIGETSVIAVNPYTSRKLVRMAGTAMNSGMIARNEPNTARFRSCNAWSASTPPRPSASIHAALPVWKSRAIWGSKRDPPVTR